MLTLARFAHLVSLGFWSGSTVFLFVLAPGVFASLPKQTAGEAMNAIFPRFYMFCYGCAAVAAVTLAILPERSAARGLLLGLAAGLLVLAGLVLGPRATALRVSRAEVEASHGATSPEATALTKEFGKLHGAIMAVDLGMLAAGIALLWVSMAPLTPAGPAAPSSRIEQGTGS